MAARVLAAYYSVLIRKRAREAERARASKRPRGQVECNHIEESTLGEDTSDSEGDHIKPNETIRALYKRVGWPRSANEKTEGEDLD